MYLRKVSVFRRKMSKSLNHDWPNIKQIYIKFLWKQLPFFIRGSIPNGCLFIRIYDNKLPTFESQIASV